MVEYGQPMHAQDLGKFDKQEIVIRRSKKGEKITTFEGTEIELDPKIFILTQNNKPIAIGGVVGGEVTGVSKTTTDIILDAGNYNQTNIRETSRKLKIQNETVLRYDKFLHPHLCQVAIERATKLILELAGGEYYENIDWYPNKKVFKKSKVTLNRIEKMSGMDFEIKKVEKILESLGYKVISKKSDTLNLEVPYFRTDIDVEDDLVADVLRISNYENIPLEGLNLAPPEEITPVIYDFEEKCRDILTNLGLNEYITDPITSHNEKLANQVELENSLSFDKNALRTTIYETLEPVLATYKKHKIDEVGVFEIGKVYAKQNDDYEEKRVLEVIYTKDALPKEINDEVKKILTGFFQVLGLDNINYKKDTTHAIIHQKTLELGCLKRDSFTLYTENLLKTEKKNLRVKSELVNEITEDITFDIGVGEDAGEIIDKIKGADRHIQKVEVLDDNYRKGTKKIITIRVTFSAPDNDLTTQKVNRIKEKKVLPILN
jgi:phenylalanyl-tRNA synthetase beta chain